MKKTIDEWNRGQKAKNCLQYAVSCWNGRLASIPEFVGKLYKTYYELVDEDTKKKFNTTADWGSLADLIYYYSNSKYTVGQNVATEFMSVLTDEIMMVDLREKKDKLSEINKCIICVNDDGAHYVYKEGEKYKDKPGQSKDSRFCEKPKSILIKGIYALMSDG